MQMKYTLHMKTFKRIFTDHHFAWIILVSVIAITLFFTCPPNSWIHELEAMSPNEHYEDGVLIRTIRGQDFIVTRSFNDEVLVPLARAPDGVNAPNTTHKPQLED